MQGVAMGNERLNGLTGRRAAASSMPKPMSKPDDIRGLSRRAGGNIRLVSAHGASPTEDTLKSTLVALEFKQPNGRVMLMRTRGANVPIQKER